MNLRKLAAGMVLLIFLWGCSVVIPPISPHAVKPLNFQSAEQQTKDYEKCSQPPSSFYLDGLIMYLLSTGGLGMWFVAQEWQRDRQLNNEYYENCMRERGYEVQKIETEN